MNTQIKFLFIIISLLAISYSLIAPLFPFIAAKHSVGDTTVGIIFSFYALSNILVIPGINSLIYYIGRKTLCYISIYICALSTISFGLISSVESSAMFVFLSMMIMLFEGIGISILSIMIYSITASLSEPSELKTNMGYLELAYSSGLSLGPFIASGLYYFFGEKTPFYFCGALTFLLGSSLISKVEISDEDTNNKTNFFSLLFNYEILLTFFVIICDMVSTTFIFPVFSIHLNKKFGLGVEITSMFFVFQIIGYCTALQILNPINYRLGNKITMILGLGINLIGILFLCPVSFIPQNWLMVVVGMTIIGFGGVLITIPGIIDIMNILKEKLKLSEVQANDNASAMYNFASALGEAFGPLMGGYITERHGFEQACFMTSLINFIFSFVFGFSNVKNIHRELKEAKVKVAFYNENPNNHSWNLDTSFSSVGALDRTAVLARNKIAFSLSKSFSNEPYSLLI